MIRADHCRMDHLEGSPIPTHPIRSRVVSIATGAIVAYATALGNQEVRLVDPLPEVTHLYTALYTAAGFVLANPKGETPYLLQKI